MPSLFVQLEEAIIDEVCDSEVVISSAWSCQSSSLYCHEDRSIHEDRSNSSLLQLAAIESRQKIRWITWISTHLDRPPSIVKISNRTQNTELWKNTLKQKTEDSRFFQNSKQNDRSDRGSFNRFDWKYGTTVVYYLSSVIKQWTIGIWIS